MISKAATGHHPLWEGDAGRRSSEPCRPTGSESASPLQSRTYQDAVHRLAGIHRVKSVRTKCPSPRP